jgi:hypothetical protein
MACPNSKIGPKKGLRHLGVNVCVETMKVAMREIGLGSLEKVSKSTLYVPRK